MQDFFQELVNQGISEDAAIEISENIGADYLEELISRFEELEDSENNNIEGVYIPADPELVEYFWNKVNARINNPNYPEQSHIQVLYYILNQL